MMKIKKLIFLFFVFGFLFLLTTQVKALVKRVRKPRTGSVVVSRGVNAYVRFRPDRLALLIDFSNFDNLESGSYQLIYETNGVQQGAGGSIILGDTSTKTLLFGTCSANVCTYHSNITNARLSITSVLKDGTTVLKPYRIRV